MAIIMNACVIIPTYNEAQNIGELIAKVKSQNFTVVVIDDGSTDDTGQIARQSGAIVLRNEQNQGKGASLIRGFKYALDNNFDAVLTMDGDGQHLPEDIPYFIRLAAYSDSGIFIGNRMHKTGDMPLIRILTNRFMSWVISSVAKQKIPDTQCGFRLIKKEVIERVKLITLKYETESEILIKASLLGFRIESVPIKAVYMNEKSRINPLIDTLRFIKFIIGVPWTTKP